jgi:hypothetical protein
MAYTAKTAIDRPGAPRSLVISSVNSSLYSVIPSLLVTSAPGLYAILLTRETMSM